MSESDWVVIGEGPDLPKSSDDDWVVVGEGPDLPSPRGGRGATGSWEPPPKKKSFVQDINDASGQLLQGLTLGFGDEITAGANSLISGDYDTELQKQREGLNAFEQEYPYWSTALQLIGSAPTAIVLPGGGGAKTLLGAAAKSGLTGALYGGVAGFGGAEGDIEDRLESAYEGAKGGAVIGGAAGGVGKLLEKALSKGASKASELASSYRADALGLRPSDAAKGSRRGKTYVDVQGNKVGIEDAVGSISRADEALDTITADNFFKGLTSDPKKLELRLDQKVASLGDESQDLMEIARKEVSKYTAQTGITPRFKPDFTEAQEYIDKVQKANPSRAKSLQNELDDVIGNWKKSSQSFDELVEFRRSAGEQPRIFSGTASAVDQEMAKLKRKIYRGFQKPIEDNFNAIVKTNYPDLVGSLAGVNKKISSYKMFEEPLRNKVAKAGPLDLVRNVGDFRNLVYTLMSGFAPSAISFPAAVALGARSFGKTMPVLASKVTDRSGRILGAGSNLTEAMAPIIGKYGSITNALTGEQHDEAEQPTNSPFIGQPTDLGTITPAGVPQPSSNQPAISPLVQAIIDVESGGNPKAVSPAGAMGLMQLMPSNARAFGVDDPFDPQQNIQGGVSLLNEELGRFGNLALALAAYNAGSPKVKKAIEKAGSTDFEDVREYLPAETKQYVSKVLDRLEG